VVEIGGDVDMATVDDLEAPVIDAIRNGRQPLILDLTDCAFMDSTGLRFLLRAHHALEECANGDGRNALAVVARGHVAGLLELTAVDKVFAVVPSRAEAEAVLAG
jgi:anti-anti-sigma factor